MIHLLAVDDSSLYLQTVTFLLEKHFKITTACGGRNALKCLEQSLYDVVLLDLEMPEIDGFKVLEEIKKMDLRTPVIILSEHADTETVVRATKMGAEAFVEKGFEQKLLISKIEQLLQQRNVSLQADQQSAVLHLKHNKMVYKSSAMQLVDSMLTRFANLDLDVFLYGESGVGKDLFAYQFHRRSKRAKGVFVNCSVGQLPESLLESELFGHKKGAFTGADENKVGKIEVANNGTLYLPEITDIPEKTQVKLLEFLDTKIINVLGYTGTAGVRYIDARTITATNTDPYKLIEDKTLREDFFYRINTNIVAIPPLRERSEDILPLIEFFAAKQSIIRPEFADITFSEELLDWCIQFKWPGNVRQLQNTVLSILSRALLFKERKASMQCLPLILLEKEPLAAKAIYTANAKEVMPFNEAEDAFKREYFTSLMNLSNRNVTEAALLSGIDRRTLYNHLNRLGLNQKSPVK